MYISSCSSLRIVALIMSFNLKKYLIPMFYKHKSLLSKYYLTGISILKGQSYVQFDKFECNVSSEFNNFLIKVHYC